MVILTKRVLYNDAIDIVAMNSKDGDRHKNIDKIQLFSSQRLTTH